MIAFIHGPDRSLARDAALAKAREIDPDGSNTTWLDARESGTGQAIAAIGAASFFGAPRVVIVTNLLGRVSRDAKSASAGSGRSAGVETDLKTLLATVPEQNLLILFEPDLDSPPKAITSATPAVTVIGGDPPRGPALIAWIGEAFERAGTRIDRRAAQFLAESLFPQTWDRKPANPRYDRPPDMALLSQEIEKLAMAAYPDPITRDLIQDLVPSGPNQRVFRFLDAATAGDLSTAHVELERLVSAGEEPAMLLAQLLGQVELMAVASEAPSRDANAISRDLGSISPSRMSAIASSAQRRRLPAAASLETGAAADRDQKTGRLRRPEDALHQLMVKLAAPTPPRGTGHTR